MEIDEQLLLLKEIKDNIGVSIENKGVSIPVGTPYVNYGDLVREIPVRYGVELSKINENFTREITDEVNIAKPDTLNVTNVGGVTIDSNYVASGFANNKYLKLPEMPDFSNANSWEIVIKFKTSQFPNTQNIVASSKDNPVLALGIETNGKSYFAIGDTTGNSWKISNIDSASSISSNIYYWVKLEFTGTAYKMSLSSDGINYSLENSFTSSHKVSYASSYQMILGQNRAGSGQTLLGSIDLKACYININNQLWWQGVTEGEVIL